MYKNKKMKVLKPINYFILLLLTLSCEKESIISSIEKNSKILGLTNTTFLGSKPVDFAIVNNVSGLDSARVPMLAFGLSAIQSTTLPNGDYVFHSSTNTPLSNRIHVYKRIRIPNTLSTYNITSNSLVNAIVYSPVTKLQYAVQADSVIQYDLDSVSLRILKRRVFPGLKCGTSDFEKNSTIHPSKPFMYIAGKNNVRRLDINTGQYITLTDTSKASIYGIRYNLHDNQVYMLYSTTGNTSLIKLDPETNAFSLVFTIPDVKGVISDDYSATIHCCKNQYIYYQSRFIYTLDIASNTSTRQQTSNICQGLFWVQD
jgi:hypothetical protein